MTVYDDNGDEIQLEQTFLGKCLGIGLSKDEDNHVLVHVLVEDDGNWFTGGNCFSSFWLDELYYNIEESERWMFANCTKTDDGYSFKD